MVHPPAGAPLIATLCAHVLRPLSLAILAWTMPHAAEAYRPDLASLRQHQPVPEWLRDGKLGIYAHWGVYSVPAFGNEWYPSYMFDRDGVNNSLRVFEHHVATYGDPAQFGYHDFIPRFTGEKFSAQEWAELYQRAGAKFGGTVTEHHDGFSMWASTVNPWNAKDLGPKRDVVGEMAQAVRGQGLKFITTFHHARMYGTRKNRPYWFRAPGWPTSSDDPRLRILYGNMPFAEGMQLWRAKLDEVVNAYRPDLAWFDVDFELVPLADRLEFIANYFNAAAAWPAEVAVITKPSQLPAGIGLVDYENHYPERLTKDTWLTDDTIGVVGSIWSYVPGMKIKSAQYLIHELLDIVSKNGQLLLNISPRADGSIPDDQRATLLGLGAWLGTYGEAVYGTRAWTVFGEGTAKKGRPATPDFPANPDQLRYTRNGSTLYACLLGNQLVGDRLTCTALASGPRVTAVRLLGSAETLTWTQGPQGLEITRPQAMPDAQANVFALTLAP